MQLNFQYNPYTFETNLPFINFFENNSNKESCFIGFVEWVREEDDWEIPRKITVFTIAFFLSLSIVGLLVVIPSAFEWNRQASIISNPIKQSNLELDNKPQQPYQNSLLPSGDHKNLEEKPQPVILTDVQDPIKVDDSSTPQEIVTIPKDIIQNILPENLPKIEVKVQERGLLDAVLFEQAKLFIDEPKKLENLPRACNGKTRVYLPDDLPVVLKQSGSPYNQQRFVKMKQGRNICERNGYESLIIPSANVYENFIIESRLPIKAHLLKEQIGLYADNRERFTNAIQEFVGFLCQSCFSDLTDGKTTDYGSLSEVPMGRYDNIALYLEEDHGKIGLVDLEEFTPGCDKWQEEWCFFRCRNAVHLFPYHLEEILNVAKKYDPNIENYRKFLTYERNEALKRFKIVHEDHLKFVKEKNIDQTDPAKFHNIAEARKENIRKFLEVKIQKKNEGFLFENCLGESPDDTLKLFSDLHLADIIDATMNSIAEILEWNVKIYKKHSSISDYYNLLTARTLVFTYNNKVYLKLKEIIKLKLDMLSFESKGKKAQFIFMLTDTIFQELANGKEIAYFNKDFGSNHRCIFC